MSAKDVGGKKQDYEEPSCKRAKLTEEKPLDSTIEPPEQKTGTAGDPPKDPPRDPPGIRSGSEAEQIPANESGDVRKWVHDLFLVKMPEDFYQFWDFCEEVCPQAPSGTHTCTAFAMYL